MPSPRRPSSPSDEQTPLGSLRRNRVKWTVLVASVALSSLAVRHALRTELTAGAPEVIDNWTDVAELLEQERARPEPYLEPGEVWKPLPREVVLRLHPGLGDRFRDFDPVRGVTRRGGMNMLRKFPEHPERGWRIRTNSLGMREDEELLARADLRILVAGDSQTEGVCANDESFPNRLEELLRAERPDAAIEVLNAGIGGMDPYFHLATFEAYRSLEPDVFVAAFYGGNDFSGVMAIERFFHGRGAPADPVSRREHDQRIPDEDAAWLTTELSQLRYFRANPGDVAVAVETCARIAVDIRRRAGEIGTRFVCLYIPPPLTGQPELYADTRETFATRLGVEEDWCELSDRMADEWIARLAAEGLHVIDLRPTFRAATEKLYWTSDPHLNLEGNRVIARSLLEAVGAAGR